MSEPLTGMDQRKSSSFFYADRDTDKFCSAGLGNRVFNANNPLFSIVLAIKSSNIRRRISKPEHASKKLEKMSKNLVKRHYFYAAYNCPYHFHCTIIH